MHHFMHLFLPMNKAFKKLMRMNIHTRRFGCVRSASTIRGRLPGCLVRRCPWPGKRFDRPPASGAHEKKSPENCQEKTGISWEPGRCGHARHRLWPEWRRGQGLPPTCQSRSPSTSLSAIDLSSRVNSRWRGPGTGSMVSRPLLSDAPVIAIRPSINSSSR